MKTRLDQVEQMLKKDPYLTAYKDIITRRLLRIDETEYHLTRGKTDICNFASGHTFFGMHRDENGWIFREWAPNATALFLIGDMTGWKENSDFALKRINNNGAWEIRLPPEKLHHGELYRLRIHWPGNSGDRIPAYARRVVQDPHTLIFNAQVWEPARPYHWQHNNFRRSSEPPLIYEIHVGMAQDAEKVGTYREFTENILDRIVDTGYNTLQLMAVQEHPYYGSFGYHVSNFFAASSRFGTPDALKALIDTAHSRGLAVIMDLIHSHAVSNTVEGLSLFDGTPYQYFHSGLRGHHHAWDSKCFDYGKPQVLHFLLSNCRYWLDEFRVDGFRLDGITSMLYSHHGLGCSFSSYDDYFNDTVDEEALTYLALANRVIHRLRPDALTIAEDISGMPGLALPEERGGFGFDFRFAMGVPDFWIKLTKDMRDETWPIGHLWYELTNRREEEATISYAESHDQALVGDKALMFRLADAAMYDHMHAADPNMTVDRAMALHKIIRLITLATAGNGYLNFMGNEFGHPEWIDFPRKGNNWSYKHAKRQWHLVDHPDLKYRMLNQFDREMIRITRQHNILSAPSPSLIWEHSDDKILAFERAGLLFIFNFHPTHSQVDYHIPVPKGPYVLILDTDKPDFGGHGRLTPAQVYPTPPREAITGHNQEIRLYLPTRTGIVLRLAG